MDKQCKKCNIVKPLDEFRNDKRLKSGKGSVCKSCSSKIARLWAIKNPDAHKNYNKNWRAANKEYDSARKMQWAKNNPELKKAADKRNYERHKERIIYRHKLYRKNNKEYFQKYRKEYTARIYHKKLAYNKYREQLKRNRTPKWLTLDDLAVMESMYLEAKTKSMLTGITYHVDHIIPLNGDLICGLHVPSNLQVITAQENLRKSNKYVP